VINDTTTWKEMFLQSEMFTQVIFEWLGVDVIFWIGLGKLCVFHRPSETPRIPWDYADEKETPGQPKRLTKKVCPTIKSCVCVLFAVCRTFHGLSNVDLNWHLINCHYYLTLLKRGALTLGETIKKAYNRTPKEFATAVGIWKHLPGWQ